MARLVGCLGRCGWSRSGLAHALVLGVVGVVGMVFSSVGAGCSRGKTAATTPPPPAVPPAQAGSGGTKAQDRAGRLDAPGGTKMRHGTMATSSGDKPFRCPPKNAMLAPISWRNDALTQRRYWTETDLSKVHTTKAEPVEVCGLREQLGWLMAAVCPDGTHPFVDPRVAHMSRVGNVGPGGRCGTTIVDLYRVPCKSKVFFVHMDLYNCGAGASPFQ